MTDRKSAEAVEPAEGAEPAELPDEVEPAAAELDEPTRELDELRDSHLRLAAEFDNYRKRTARERLEGHTRAQAELAGRLLESLDDLDRVAALDPAGASARDVIEGVELVDRKLRRQLELAGLQQVGAVGDPFDPNLMEAMGSLPATDPGQDQTVAMVFQPGYRFGGHLVRPARVQVFVLQSDVDGA